MDGPCLETVRIQSRQIVTDGLSESSVVVVARVDLHTLGCFNTKLRSHFSRRMRSLGGILNYSVRLSLRELPLSLLVVTLALGIEDSIWALSTEFLFALRGSKSCAGRTLITMSHRCLGTPLSTRPFSKIFQYHPLVLKSRQCRTNPGNSLMIVPTTRKHRPPPGITSPPRPSR